MSIKSTASVLAAAFLTLAPAMASATAFTNTYAIQASGFSRFAGPGSSTPPFASIDSQFTVTFDSTANSSGLLGTDLGLPSPYGVALRYTYQGSTDRLNISQTPSSSNNNDGPFTDGSIYFSIQGASTATPSIRSIAGYNMIVTNTAGDAQYQPSNISVRLVPAATPSVPEPATWAMMILGIGAVGYAMRRRQRIAVTYA